MNDDKRNDQHMMADLLRRLADVLRDYGVLRPEPYKEVIGRIDAQYRPPT